MQKAAREPRLPNCIPNFEVKNLLAGAYNRFNCRWNELVEANVYESTPSSTMYFPNCSERTRNKKKRLPVH
jgi:hypothetical protein